MKILLGISFILVFALSFTPIFVFAAEGANCEQDSECTDGVEVCIGGLCVNADKLPGTGFRLGSTQDAPDTGSAVLGLSQTGSLPYSWQCP